MNHTPRSSDGEGLVSKGIPFGLAQRSDLGMLCAVITGVTSTDRTTVADGVPKHLWNDFLNSPPPYLSVITVWNGWMLGNGLIYSVLFKSRSMERG